RQAGRCRPCLEALEDRRLLTLYLVTNTNDVGAGSLRQAILDANAHSNTLNSGNAPDFIWFRIGNGGPQTITPLSALPFVTEAVVLDATTQPGYSSGHPLIEISGANFSDNTTSGLLLFGSGGSTVTGFIINGFPYAGVEALGSSNNTIQSNYLGTDASGTM